MNRKSLAAASAMAISTFAAVALAQDTSAPRHPMMEGHGQPGPRTGAQSMQGMQGMQGMHGMMEMMQRCHGMMGRQGSGVGTVPQLPPGNEKLEAQMWGEIMQKTGEIVSKYAGQAKP